MRISNKLLLVLSSVALLSGCNNKQACPECPQCKQLVVNELINFHESLEEKIDSLEFVSSVDMEDLATDMNKLCLEGNETLLSGNLDKDDAELVLNKYKSAIASRFEETSLLNTENGKRYYYNKLQEDVIELINQLKDAGYEDAYINQFSKEKDPIMFEALPAIQSASTLEEAKSIYDDASSEIEIIFSRYI